MDIQDKHEQPCKLIDILVQMNLYAVEQSATAGAGDLIEISLDAIHMGRAERIFPKW